MNPTSHLNLERPDYASQAWYDAFIGVRDTLDVVAAPRGCYYVSPDFTDAALGNAAATDRRHFDTVQGAINAAEANADYSLRTVVLFPGMYQENVVIAKSISLVGAGGAGWMQSSRPTIVTITADSPISVVPAAGTTIFVSIAHVGIGNWWAGSTVQSWPFLLSVEDQGSGNYGGYRNGIALTDVHCRVDTTPATFGSAIAVAGWSSLMMRNCSLKTPSTITYPIALTGNGAAAKPAGCYIVNSTFEREAGGLFLRGNGGCDGVVLRSAFSSSRAQSWSAGGSGTNYATGLMNDGESAEMQNIFGRYLNGLI